LTGDRALIERMIANLLDNAIRHNIPNGNVDISTDRANNRPRLAISNSGPIINPPDLQRLFQPFQRLGVARTHTTDGYGLGLTIVKAIADTHGATLTVTARQDGGIDATAEFPT
jgi:signal transduction histidine kinase